MKMLFLFAIVLSCVAWAQGAYSQSVGLKIHYDVEHKSLGRMSRTEKVQNNEATSLLIELDSVLNKENFPCTYNGVKYILNKIVEFPNKLKEPTLISVNLKSEIETETEKYYNIVENPRSGRRVQNPRRPHFESKNITKEDFTISIQSHFDKYSFNAKDFCEGEAVETKVDNIFAK